MADISTLSYRSTGAVGADRLVAVVRSGMAALEDPGPHDTAIRGIRLLLVRMPLLGIDDPEAFGGETPDEEHAAALVDLLRHEGASADAPIGLVGVAEVGWRAIAAAAELRDAVDRLALVGVDEPESPLDRDDAVELVGRVTAETLILDAEDRDAAMSWLHRARGEALVEAVPGGGPLALSAVWERVLAHAAPAAEDR